MKYIGATNGTVSVFEKPTPAIKPKYVLVHTKFSAISPGTETTMRRNSKDEIVQLGYSAAGVVSAVGDEVKGIAVDDRVAVYGAPYTYHGEYLLVPQTLVVPLPDSITMQEASIGGIGSIAIHALRIADLKFGEVAVVVGMGIYGQLIGQIAHQAGIQVIALNRSQPRATLFEQVSGLKAFTDEHEMEAELARLTGGRGADAVLLCAGGDSNYLTNKSLEWLRDKGKSVIVGDIQPNYTRDLMFSKEIKLLISRAGGPGRYDPSFEADAVDYPYGFVRWTEGRNVAEFIRLVADKRIFITDYIGGIHQLADAPQVYPELNNHKHGALTELFEY